MNLYCSECGANIMWIPPSRPLPEKLRQFCPHCNKVVDLTDCPPEEPAKPSPIPREREILMITDGVPNFLKATGIEFCRMPETSRTRKSTQLHVRYHSDGANEAWIPLDNPHSITFYRTTGRNMEIISEIMGVRSRILDLEKQILERIGHLQDPITDENIAEYFYHNVDGLDE